jgi:hypothetical protein
MKVPFRKLYPYQPYLNTEVGFETSLPDNATEEEMIAELDRLNDITDRWHRKRYPEMYTPVEQVADNPAVPVRTIDKELGAEHFDLIASINSCTELKVLETYKLMIRGDKAAQQAYNQKAQELL